MKILVPLDGSRIAEAAVPLALRLADEPKASLVLLGVVSVRAGEDPAPAEPEGVVIRDARLYLDSARDRLAPRPEGVITIVWSGSAASAIVKVAQTYGVDMIVMTTHGRSGRQYDMFGSVAQGVLRGAPMPVVVLRGRLDAIEPSSPGPRGAD